MASSYGYYDELSGNDDDDDDDDNDDDDDEDCDAMMTAIMGNNNSSTGSGNAAPPTPMRPPIVHRGLLPPPLPMVLPDSTDDRRRIIVHADVDCFYCQCEAMDRRIPPDRPFAVTQKHIVVTCNYVARKKWGITKLQSKDQALQKCPSLLLIDGSDLERYRGHSRRIYESFRRACQLLGGSGSSSSSRTKKDPNRTIPVCKGSMDEMMCDLTAAFPPATMEDHSNDDVNGESSQLTALLESTEDIFIYGDQPSSTVTLTEDQSGISVQVNGTVVQSSTNQYYISAHSRTNRTDLQRFLLRGAMLAKQIRARVLSESGFAVTMGVSTNPCLAKLSSGLQKPGKVNVLYPWRALSLLHPMPLRKLPGVGYRTAKILEPCLMAHCTTQSNDNTTTKLRPSFWSCRDLLQVPKWEIIQCLKRVPAFSNSSTRICDMILHRCQGHDDSEVVDDHGGLSKMISVENSFRRGTLNIRPAIIVALEELTCRLPRLVTSRREWSNSPDRAYPTTFRLTLRWVDATHRLLQHGDGRGSRRPFVTRSKQVGIAPILFFKHIKEHTLPDLLKKLALELLDSLWRKSPAPGAPLDVTRMNIALDGFQDVASGSAVTTSIISQYGRLPHIGATTRTSLSSPITDQLLKYTQPETKARMKTIDEFYGPVLKKRKKDTGLP